MSRRSAIGAEVWKVETAQHPWGSPHRPEAAVDGPSTAVTATVASTRSAKLGSRDTVQAAEMLGSGLGGSELLST
jgi:hypothetical protein